MNAVTKLGDVEDNVPLEGPTLSWNCVFANCGKLRIWEGGRPDPFSHLDTCSTCNSRVAVASADREAIRVLIAEHLL
jgi:hypothetical protein